ncbi:Major Facilitator Superfamily [Ruminiclostridium cellobioparum subsp. termitidis CT1112]|uniref:Major Facilitator Superfamily n=1 Tax=Ruminiclostridium cellobioparum subsp. termitidis CT1112 TaxID=1195236 RepID=S0FIZ6_RUMCE|nr:Major Facilitator Superfamily [Ruminiclostridium cellobioparum subsp. termitidis CT1112]
MSNNIKILRNIAGNFKILHLFSWAAVGAYNPFIVVYLMNNNISTSRIGVILMFNSIATLVGQPLWGMISDKIRSIKKVYLLCHSLATALIVLLPFVTNQYIIFILLPLIQFFYCSMSPLLDSWTIHSIKNSGKSYGSFRLWGSLGFSILVVINGKLITISFFNIIFLVYAIISLINLIMCAALFEYKRDDENVQAKPLTLRELNIGRLLRNFHYTAFVILSSITFMTMTSVYSFLATLIKQVGGDDNLYGIANAVSAFSEVPILLISSMLVRKFKPQYLILTGMFVYSIRLFLYSIASGPEIAIFSQSLNGLSYGMFLAGSIYYIDSLAPAELKATAQTVATAIYAGLSGIIGNVAVGNMISRFGILQVYRSGSIIQFCVFIVFLVSLYLGKRITSTGKTVEAGIN